MFQHGVDKKRRVAVPAKWRGASGEELTVVLWRSHPAGSCLRVLPPAELAKVRQTINSLPQGDPKRGVLKRLIGADSEQVQLDAAGRILLPERMAKEASLETDVTLVGMLDSFEIWNPNRYTAARGQDEAAAPDAFKMLD